MKAITNHGWKYKNLSILFFGIVLAIVLSQIESFHTFLLHLNRFGYFGTFMAEIFFISTFIEIALIASFKVVVGDLLIFYLIKDNLFDEIKDIYNYFRHSKLYWIIF